MDNKQLEKCAKVFLEKQSKLFDEDVVFSIEEAKEFLEESYAFYCKDIKELREALKEEGMDVSEFDDEELSNQLEVFKLDDGGFFYVEG